MDMQYRAERPMNITTAERAVRAAVGAGALIGVLAGVADTPQLIFTLSILGSYLIQTGTSGKDPVYAIAKYIRVADRLQVWQHTVTTGVFVPILIAGDLASSFFVFILSAIGGLLATTAMVGRDAFEALATWLFPRRKEAAPMGMLMGSPRKEAPA